MKSTTFLATLLCMAGFAAASPPEWVFDGQVTDFYVWRTLPRAEVAKVCRLTFDEAQIGGGCAPVRLTSGNAIVPAEARRMGDDSPVGEITVGRLCWIYSTATWAEAIWTRDAEDDLSHLAHEKKHCMGYSHPEVPR